jgi:sulfite oxidase
MLGEHDRRARHVFVQVIGADLETRSFSLSELKEKYPKVTVTTTLQCAGNRRKDMSDVRTVNGLLWDTSISTAKWSGALLKDVLTDMGVKIGDAAQHVQFVGLDCDMSGGLPLIPCALTRG